MKDLSGGNAKQIAAGMPGIVPGDPSTYAWTVDPGLAKPGEKVRWLADGNIYTGVVSSEKVPHGPLVIADVQIKQGADASGGGQ